ncbi:tyrosine-type recombinase/integrase [Micromonospora sp. NPDC007208]|uniref:tyrosine-type recombinase/integrase n=1 Tax=Micromonospora sp. NPDC007208 TaxID=3364236 RepID=UPI0036BD60F6
MWVEKHGPGWRIREQVGGRKVTIESGYPNKTSAKAAIARMSTDRARGEYIDPRAGRVTLNSWIDAWWPSYAATLKATTQRTEDSRVRNHIRALLGDLPLDEVDTLTIQQFVSQLAAGGPGRRPISPKTIRNVHAILHKLLDAAVAQRLIRVNPAGSTGLPKVRRQEMRFLTTPEIGRLLAATPEHWAPLVMLLVATGLRYGEATALRVSRVDVLAGRLEVLEAMHDGIGGVPILTDPKTERSRRTVTFPPTVGHALAPLLVDRDRNAFLFTDLDGVRPVTRNFRQRVWPRILADAGLGRLRLHDLRHTHVAHLISAGVPLTAVSRRMGHASISVTSDVYGHLLSEVDEGIMTTVVGMLPPLPVGGNLGGTVPEQTGEDRSSPAQSARQSPS